MIVTSFFFVFDLRRHYCHLSFEMVTLSWGTFTNFLLSMTKALFYSDDFNFGFHNGICCMVDRCYAPPLVDRGSVEKGLSERRSAGRSSVDCKNVPLSSCLQACF